MSLALRHRVVPLCARMRVPAQVALYALLFVFSQWLVSRFSLPLPANIVGMVLMLILIALRIVPLAWVKAGSRWLLAEMLLFFVPAVVAVVNYAALLMVEGWRIVAVIALSTVLTLGLTALVVDRVYRLELRLQRRRRAVVEPS
ncbi:CidA/LrgA family protein [Edwardsiella tarda]|uniref:CidA/LrgA family protein n=1 Tax=Edwardsiella tarda ATCC 15947 = NBRC 105688 TaxID=667121 RepID=A0AC61TJF2_EDWTA|nr:CidA/LrgA family protein [Edwardsiella tarda]ATI64526.1 murein hydrolase regulator LrgA [Edwardsiella tarda]UAL56373.1 CidA/LrgA family protein [Edwardsiella tarda]UCQ00568.1 CidA/LrgA family protein [Edwardsiella tarda ATCC 15947 = NBRC 105688]UCQ18176.1 CidA/LrgA family protein [Edwardsiella tarda]UCQ28041.1 CidA/LrgA family protein [Edwardsiella tarda]